VSAGDRAAPAAGRWDVAVVVPARDSAAYLEEAIRSALGQSLRPAEICVAVDGGSTDASEAIAASFAPAVRVVRIPPVGIPGITRQAAADATRSPLVASLDADDLWFPHKLERQVALMQQDPSLDGVFAHVDEFLSPDLAPGERRGVRSPLTGVKGRIASALLIERRALAGMGGFGSEAHPAEWIRWVSRAERAGLRLGVVPEVLVRRRIHSANLTRRYAGDYGAMLSTVREHLAGGGPGASGL
jgi:glycosyltransferase involved in cell wall biosynthesis